MKSQSSYALALIRIRAARVARPYFPTIRVLTVIKTPNQGTVLGRGRVMPICSAIVRDTRTCSVAAPNIVVVPFQHYVLGTLLSRVDDGGSMAAQLLT